ncbi:MAG: hypothetical protein R6W73_09980 [Candidatus Saliniplasma sp.]
MAKDTRFIIKIGMDTAIIPDEKRIEFDIFILELTFRFSVNVSTITTNSMLTTPEDKILSGTSPYMIYEKIGVKPMIQKYMPISLIILGIFSLYDMDFSNVRTTPKNRLNSKAWTKSKCTEKFSMPLSPIRRPVSSNPTHSIYSSRYVGPGITIKFFRSEDSIGVHTHKT